MRFCHCHCQLRHHLDAIQVNFLSSRVYMTFSGTSDRRKRSAGGSYSVSMAVASCRAWDPDLNDWIELGTVVGAFSIRPNGCS